MRPFSDFLREHRNGKFHDDISQALAELVGEVERLHKKGTLTIKLVVEPLGEHNVAVAVYDEVSVKAPKLLPSSVFFLDGDSLSKEDPQRPTLKLEAVKAPARVYDPETGEVEEAS